MRERAHVLNSHAQLICPSGLFATLMAARIPQLRFLINVSGQPWESLPMSMRDQPMVECPSLHLVSTKDFVMSLNELLSLSRRCERTTFVWHNWGHALPGLKGSEASEETGAIVTAFLSSITSSVPETMASTAAMASTPPTIHSLGSTLWKSSREVFLWRKLVERQRRWYQHEAGAMLMDADSRFLPSEANPFPGWSPQDKMMEREFVKGLSISVPMTAVIAVITDPSELLELSLPRSWVVKPIGASGFEGVSVINEAR